MGARERERERGREYERRKVDRTILTVYFIIISIDYISNTKECQHWVCTKKLSNKTININSELRKIMCNYK